MICRAHGLKQTYGINAQVRTFLHEAGKILRHVFEALGGSSVLLAATDSPVMCAAKLAKITIDCRWEEVFRRYDPQDPWTRGKYYVMSNNAQVKRAMYGFMDQSLTSQRAVGEVNDSQALPESEFVRMLSAMLMDGAFPASARASPWRINTTSIVSASGLTALTIHVSIIRFGLRLIPARSYSTAGHNLQGLSIGCLPRVALDRTKLGLGS